MIKGLPFLVKAGSCSVFILSLFFLTQLPWKTGGFPLSGILGENIFTDDAGNRINTESGGGSLVSLSPMHTENIYYIGGGDLISGTDKESVFPPEALHKEKYDLDKVSDLNRLIRNKPSWVLSDPLVNRKYRPFISALEASGIPVITLMPESLKDFDFYIRKLAMLTGLRAEGERRLKEFHEELEKLRKESDQITSGTTVFLEVSEKGYLTPAPDSPEGEAVSLAGLTLLTPERGLFSSGERYVRAGLEFIYENRDRIDLYLTLKGPGYSGTSYNSLMQKMDFQRVKAVKNNKAFEFPSGLLAGYSFRYPEGIRELKRLAWGDFVTPETESEKPLNRRDFAFMIYSELKLPLYTVWSSSYYEQKRFGHIYGSFEDVKFTDEDFSVIETVCSRAFLHPVKERGKVTFQREKQILYKDLLSFATLWRDIPEEEAELVLKEEGLFKKKNYYKGDLEKLMTLFRGKNSD